MTKYAANTSVASDRSRAEIERTLVRYGANSFAYGWEESKAIIMFRAHGRHIQFVLPIPTADDDKYVYHSRGVRTSAAREAAYEQDVRQRWRAMALVIKAKLEAVETGIVTFDDEFLAHIVLPSGATAGEWMIPQIQDAYETGGMPSLLPGTQAQLEEGSGR